MLTWDIRWKEREADVASLNPPDRLKLSLVCIDDVLADLAPSFQSSLPAELRSSIRAALDSLWSGSWNDRSAVQSDLESQLENDDIPGLYDLLMAMYTLVYVGKNPGTEDSLESISFSYQAILDTEIL